MVCKLIFDCDKVFYNHPYSKRRVLYYYGAIDDLSFKKCLLSYWSINELPFVKRYNKTWS